MRRITVGIFLLSFASLVTEITLIRVFDVLFYPNIAYTIITCSMFAFGLAGVYYVLRPIPPGQDFLVVIAKWSVFFSFSVAMIRPVLNALPFDINLLATQPVQQIIYFAGMYASLTIPFFMVGLLITAIFSENVKRIQKLYFWDLSGAALGSVLIIPFISKIGPGGLLLFASSVGLIASALFANKKSWSWAAGSLSLFLILFPLIYSPNYLDFNEHQGKRGVKAARERGLIEETRWDPISKIDVINYDKIRYIAYDGGSQTSVFYPFDGDFEALKAALPFELDEHFWQRGVLASHYIKEATNPDVLVIGSAGGQEIKAALLYGAKSVVGIELVKAVVDLGKTRYSDYIGGLFLHPLVSVFEGEGRSYLRSNHQKFDIIQIFSNHTSSSVAAGTGAVATNYLQTADAYEEYFSHLTGDGILHINHFYYPKMITTASLAWSQMGLKDFHRHVVVFDYEQDETLPTFLVKMEPWTAEEMERLKYFFSPDFSDEDATYTLVVDPLNPDVNAIPISYFSGILADDVIHTVETRIQPSTDNIPYFNLLQKSLNPFPNGLQKFFQNPVGNLPMGLLAIYITGVVALIYSVLFILVPLNFSSLGRHSWPKKNKSLIYFSCLGAGFIIIEFVFIQIFMGLIGSPLYTYSSVIFITLLGAGIGSISSNRLRISPDYRWFWPFVGIFTSIIFLLLVYPITSEYFLAMPLFIRILIGFIFMFPVGFFLGMPFPLGILSLADQPKGAVAWAWGMNGLFTVIGGLLGILFSIRWGFTITLLIACGIYFLAMVLFYLLTQPTKKNYGRFSAH
jgi:spermidine synthase